MYAFISGTLAATTLSYAVIDNGGIGYKIFATKRFLETTPVGDEVKLYTYLIVREDEFSLYGFETEDDQRMFERLISVSGVGPKSALGILSEMDASQIANAVVSGDRGSFTKVSGIGPKAAERIILDLKDKIAISEVVGQTGGKNDSRGAMSEAIEALVSLGYSRMQAVNAVKSVSALGDTTEELVLYALKALDNR
ncbi:MAG: Holliday junction branch migration protein RuvA [Clostridia bacterium]|nr:Holliday junction branch migration protein RuvA [Clostridia bacterium]